MARAVAIVLGLMAVASPAEAAALCESLFVPDGYTLICETRIESGQRSERVVVRPSGGTAASLAELTIRPLERATAPLAWTAPQQWLADQVAVDVSGLSTGLQNLGGTAFLAHPAAKATVDGLVTMLTGWSKLPAEACTPEEKPLRHDLRCRWGIEPVALEMSQRLVEAGEQRFAVSYWAADEQRLRHLEAIANSFNPA
jgi:hypothetical protein